MPVVKVKQNGVWEEVDGVSNHTHPEYASVVVLGDLQESVDRMSGILTTSGIVLTEGIDYGDDIPGSGTLGQLYFKRVT